MGLVVSIALSACGGGGGDEPGGAAPEKFQIVAPTVADADQPVAFRSTLGSTTGLTLSWDFGDGSTSHEAEPSHRYAKAGDYEVSLAATDAAGGVYKISVPVSVRHLANVNGAVCSGAEQGGWCWQHPLPVGNDTPNIWFLDAKIGWAVGSAGQILKTIDAGATWQAQRSGVDSTLLQVVFADANNGWVFGDGATLLHTTDGGQHWIQQALGLQSLHDYDHQLVVSDAQHALLSGNESRVTADGGEHWAVIEAVDHPVVTSPTTIWSYGSYGPSRKVLRSTDAGQHFSVSLADAEEGLPGYPGRQLVDANFFDDQHAKLHTYDYFSGKLEYMDTADGGITWQDIRPAALPTDGATWRAKFFSQKIGWGLSGAGKLYRTTDGGINWALSGERSDYLLSNVDFLDGQSVSTSGSGDGRFHLTRDGGANWTSFVIEDQQLFYTPTIRQLGDVLLLTVNERTYRSADNGLTWQRVLGNDPKDDYGAVVGIWMFDGRKGLASTSSGWLLDTSDGGATWQRRATVEPHGPSLGKLQFSDAVNGWMLSWESGLLRSSNAGQSWLQPAGSVERNLSDFQFIDSATGWSVGDDGSIYKSNDAAQSWTKIGSAASGLLGVRFFDDQVGLVVGYAGLISRTADGGATWTSRASNTGARLQRVYFSTGMDAWAIGAQGTLLHSSDAGLTWKSVPLPTQALLTDIQFNGPLNGWIVGDRGTVLSTRDGGKTWVIQPTGTGRTLWSVYFDDPLTGWMGGDAGTVLSTANGGR
ncbi:YCF48-related protein [Ideonella azotifigens]|uniref:PKD domain-containing protein n=2 Tax=Ideonella azotifigens TaxID=513160 RepID=A0ABN1K575_9BURK|nr:YCF48-related protein [Ideonella azotifigens]